MTTLRSAPPLVLTLALALPLLGAGAWGCAGRVREGATGGSEPRTEAPAGAREADRDDGGARGPVQVDESRVVLLGSFPQRPVLHLRGHLPTPCHDVRVSLSRPALETWTTPSTLSTASGEIAVEVWSRVRRNEACAQVLHPFERELPLGNLLPGTYRVTVNGAEADTFVLDH